MKINICRATKADSVPWALLLEADPSRSQVNKYIKKGELYLAYSSKNIIGTMVLLQTSMAALEIINIAVNNKFQRKGVGTQLLKFAKTRAKYLKKSRLHVGTGNCSFQQLAFYQRFGFRIIGVNRDFFKFRYRKSYRVDGVRLIDMIRMEIKL